MDNLSIDDILRYLKNNRKFFHDNFGVTSIGIFGSFVQGKQTSSSDIDIVIEMEKTRKSIHTFLQLKRFLEKEIKRKVDLGFENSLKPAVKEKIKGQIIYV
ncbi:MAG: nucleotidyltransferase family protein [Nitrospirae bacterium]|nr:nucleotidyltransferase family protein [Nitrospirota bacterium]